MCLYVQYTCPGSCGRILVERDLEAPCISFGIDPQPDDPGRPEEPHDIVERSVPILGEDESRLFPDGYWCTDPSCSRHPDAFTVANLDHAFRCPDCGFVNRSFGGVFHIDVAATGAVHRGDLRVPFLHRSLWAYFICARHYCRSNPLIRNILRAAIQYQKDKMYATFLDQQEES